MDIHPELTQYTRLSEKRTYNINDLPMQGITAKLLNKVDRQADALCSLVPAKRLGSLFYASCTDNLRKNSGLKYQIV